MVSDQFRGGSEDLSLAVSTVIQNNRQRIIRRHWLAWMGMCGALAIHVVDETVTDFLSLQNSTVLALREQYPFLPIPTFTFAVWLSLLIFAVISLTSVSWFVWKGRWAMRPISYIFATFMLLNALFHVAISIYMGELVSGVYSSPLLLAASIALIVSTLAFKHIQHR